MKFKFPLVVCLLFPAFACLHAQDAPPVNAKSVLDTLKVIKQKQHDDIKADEVKLAQQFMAKGADVSEAVAFYKDAVRAIQFAGQSHEGKEYQDWEKKSDGRLKDKDFRTALCLHLVYLSLTITHDNGAKMKDLLPELLTYIQQVEANEADLYGQEEMMRQPLSNSIFVRWFQIGQYVQDTKTWEPVPINIDGMYQKVILPEYRRTKNAAEIFKYWDGKIAKESDSATKSGRSFDLDRFNTSTKPQLLWSRAQEYAALGLPNQAINEMMAVIKAYPYHPSAPDWVSQVEGMVKLPPPAAVAATPAPVAPAATPAPEPEAAATTPAPTPEETAPAPPQN